MSTVAELPDITRGCSFLVEEHALDRIFIPEEFTEDERMIAQLATDFVEGSVVPKLDAVEAQEPGVTEALIKEAGELGLIGVDMPEEYGGFEQKKAVSMRVAEKLAKTGSFQVVHGAQTGIGTLPIVYFGTREQKQKYLPKLAAGEWIGAYALTEAGSGSDALAAKSRAVLDADGTHYVLNGEKMFITNSRFADVFIVFAQVVDGDDLKFTAFILEKGMEGLSTGAEETKMGLKGSSTRTVIMQDVRVPVDHVLGEVGRGHVIAFNILNVGRFKLGASAVGSGIESMLTAVTYGKQRKQFGKPITDFGMIKHKVGEMAARLFAAQSMVYRTAGYIDQNVSTLDRESRSFDRDVIEIGIHEYATECSMMKVFCSETLDYCVDEEVQIHGGYGYIAEYDAERHYRDSRINRIWEGTNEINRLVMLNEVMKKALKNELPIFARAKALQDELMGFPTLEADEDDEFMAAERRLVEKGKKAVLLALGTAAQQLGEKMRDAQEVIAYLADMLMDVYGMESSLFRTLKLEARGDHDQAAVSANMTRLFCNDAMSRLEIAARNVLSAVCEGDLLTATMSGLRRTVKHRAVDSVTLRREIADVIIEKESWPF